MHDLAEDGKLRKHSELVLPGGVYGHMNMSRLPEGYPQFMRSGRGCRLTDVDGNDYIDYMCGWGPVVLGRCDPAVDAAVTRQLSAGDVFNGATPAMVELAELLTQTIDHADWVMFGKNGTDATTAAVTIARGFTGKSKILLAEHSYHGAIPWCTPGKHGVTGEDTANQVRFIYNDVDSLRAAVAAAGEDFAAIIVAPVHQPINRKNEYANAEFAREARHLCDTAGAVLILDEVRVGFRLDLRGSWSRFGVQPDLAAWSKAIANGHPLSAVTGTSRMRDSAKTVYVTGSFWFSAAPMVAAIETITQLRDSDALQRIERAGTALVSGLRQQLEDYGIAGEVSGPVQMPLLLFGGEAGQARGRRFAQGCVRSGVFLHPTHNWFISAAHTAEDVARTLEVTGRVLSTLAREVVETR